MSPRFITNTLHGKETNGDKWKDARRRQKVRSLERGWKLLCIGFEWFDEHLAELLKLLRTPDFLRE